MTTVPHENRPGTFAKGNIVRRADRPVDVVALRFAGWKRVEEQTPDDASYRELQEQAKSVGIPANQSTDALLEALAQYENDGGTPAADES